MSNADASLIGKRFGKLTVLDLDHVGKYVSIIEEFMNVEEK